MFERLQPSRKDPGRDEVRIFVDGEPVPARVGDTVAVALLAAGVIALRVSAPDGQMRGPYCMMGVCYDCRVTIDGQPGTQACVTPVADGMRVILEPPQDSGTNGTTGGGDA